MSKLEDESAIRRLLSEYCHHYDDNRADEFAALFTDDATFTIIGNTHAGRQAIHDNIALQKPGQDPGQHISFNYVIDVSPDRETARAWTDFCYLRRSGHKYSITIAGRYFDRLVRNPDRWRFASRTIVFVGDPVPDDA